ncbi:hypothetical protein [Geodermatophilus tzadiensis]|uniref:hypothetical protein n=1 Tax=Geodermatophilus tzadiensis TaxID=1137988 RepID=UPI000D0795AF|nr:hypothetical protein [Geodermatophilus tzadiensis]
MGYNLGHSAAERQRALADASVAAAAAAAVDSRLSEAYQACRIADQSNTLELGDGDDSLIVDTQRVYER